MHATNVRRMIEPEPQDGLFDIGEVVGVSEEGVVVKLENGEQVDARRAASCLVQPSQGDLVALLPLPTRAMHYVVAVLERAEDGAIGIFAPGGLQISVPHGRFAVAAEGVDLIGKKMGLQAEEIDIQAQRVDLSFRQLAARGKEMLAHSDAFKLVGRVASAVLERVTSRVDRSYRVVTELEHLSARELSYSVTECASLHAKHSLVTAEDLVKVDGKQIHIG